MRKNREEIICVSPKPMSDGDALKIKKIKKAIPSCDLKHLSLMHY